MEGSLEAGVEAKPKANLGSRQETGVEGGMEADLGARLEGNLVASMEENLEARLDFRVVPQSRPSRRSSSPRARARTRSPSYRRMGQTRRWCRSFLSASCNHSTSRQSSSSENIHGNGQGAPLPIQLGYVRELLIYFQ